MNGLWKKKAAEAPEPLVSDYGTVNAFLAGSQPPTSPPPPALKKSASRWKRNKKPIQPKPELDLTFALPSNDDFRTSLFMPALTARFSMLREQDDPNSILGKASDDSVLQPRRRSRMDFGLAKGGLDDIAEVASVRSVESSVRPPFSGRRQDSCTSEDYYHSEGESTRGGSMMSRARFAEGNSMFGGRQKVQMSTKSTIGSAKRNGRTLYHDHIGSWSSSKTKQESEIESVRPSTESHGFDFGLEQTEAGGEDDRVQSLPAESSRNLSHSPSLSSSENKWSTNSTHSEAAQSDGRMSTAATSVASQPPLSTTSPTKPTSQPLPAPTTSQPLPAPTTSQTLPAPTLPTTSAQPLKRMDTKIRRLYEQGLDQHMQEQQNSALSRLNSIQRQRTIGSNHPPFYLQSTKSAGNINEKARQPVYALPEQDSPTTTPILSPYALASSNGANSTLSDPISPHCGMDLNEYNALNQALEPADRGKATAMGAFNKPQQSFDEEQYNERQRQLQRSASTAATRKTSNPKAGARDSPVDVPEKPEIAYPNAPKETRRRSRSAPRIHEPTDAYNVFQNAAQRMETQDSAPKIDKTEYPDTHTTFFSSVGGSDSDEDSQASVHPMFRMPDYGYGTHHGKWQPTVLPSVLEHPALRTQTSKAGLTNDDKDMQVNPLQTSLEPPKELVPRNVTGMQTLGVEMPAASLRRSHLMRSLRPESHISVATVNTDRASTIDDSDLFGPPSQTLDLVEPPAASTVSAGSRVQSYANSNPWDLDEAETVTQDEGRGSRASISPVDAEPVVRPFESHLSSFKSRQSEVSDMESDKHKDAPKENGVESHHARDSSTATQQDRDALNSELAARASAIQESIKSKLERDNQSRGPSPAQSTHNSGLKSFAMLRSKPSREFFEQSPMPEAPFNAPPKALKILGSSTATANLSSTTVNSHHGSGKWNPDTGRNSDDSNSKSPVSSSEARNGQLAGPDTRRPLQQSRSRENSAAGTVLSSTRSPPSSADGRSRANSAATSRRSRSRTGPYRDDLEKAMVEGTGMSTTPVPELATSATRELTPRSTPDSTQSPFEPARERSSSRVGLGGYFDAKSLHPIATGSRERLTPGVPSPALTPNSHSPMLSASPLSPAGSFAHNMTPPLSGASTPLQSSFTPPPPIPFHSSRPAGMLRKKTISKGDISEPTLISSTSNIDLVDLPEGASLRNGTQEAPPIPPLNPARRATKRILGLGRKESSDSTVSNRSRSKTPDVHFRRTHESEPPFDFTQMSRNRSDTLSPQKPTPPERRFDEFSGMKANESTRSLEQVERSPPPLPISMDGGMF